MSRKPTVELARQRAVNNQRSSRSFPADRRHVRMSLLVPLPHYHSTLRSVMVVTVVER